MAKRQRMNLWRAPARPLVLASALLLLAFAQAQGVPSAAPPAPPERPATPTHAPIASEADFVRAMLLHHREAVNVADLAVERGEREEVRAFAQGIVEGQSRELELLEIWLADLPAGAEADLYEPTMRDLVSLAPEEVDRVFLEDMLRHHEMSVAMAEAYLAGSFPKRPEIAELAETIIRTQREEQRLMEAWLLEWYGVSPSPPAD